MLSTVGAGLPTDSREQNTPWGCPKTTKRNVTEMHHSLTGRGSWNSNFRKARNEDAFLWYRRIRLFRQLKGTLYRAHPGLRTLDVQLSLPAEAYLVFVLLANRNNVRTVAALTTLGTATRE